MSPRWLSGVVLSMLLLGAACNAGDPVEIRVPAGYEGVVRIEGRAGAGAPAPRRENGRKIYEVGPDGRAAYDLGERRSSEPFEVYVVEPGGAKRRLHQDGKPCARPDEVQVLNASVGGGDDPARPGERMRWISIEVGRPKQCPPAP